MQDVMDSSLIGSIDFGLFDPEFVRKFAACEVDKPVIIENGKIVEGGLSDLRMGTMSPLQLCQTCNGTLHTCPGHFGYIELAEPFFHVGFHDKIYKILQMVCHHCGRLNCDYSNPQLQHIVKNCKGKERFNRVFELIGKKSGGKCRYIDKSEKNQQVETDEASFDAVSDDRFWDIVNGGPEGPHKRMNQPCGKEIPAVQMGKDLMVKYKNDQNGVDYPSAETVLRILSSMTDQDVRILGFNVERSHPKWMILQVLPVPPLTVRPQVEAPGQSRPSQDDVTHKLVTIIQFNNRLKELKKQSATDTALKEVRQFMQYHLTTYMINDKPSILRATTKNGRPLKVISQRLKGKEGHIRGHLSGKRDDFSARSVISPDPSISIDQVGVPMELAKILTFPEIVTTTNQKWLENIVMKGPEEIGGANFVTSDHGVKTNLAMVADLSSQNLAPGYIVERHIRDDDIVIFNRQPSLHKMSMMGHRAFLISGRTFRLNLCDTTPYNADFDGDEMNMHVPQSQTARAEVRHIMAVPRQIISPQANKPVIGLVQDALLGCRLLSKRDTFLTRDQVMNLMMWLPPEKNNILPPPCILKPAQLWSGKQVFSLFLPRINHESFSSDAKDVDKKSKISASDTHVIIRDGRLLAGILDKKTVARAEQSLIHVVINSYSTEIAKEFLNQTQLVVNNWLEHRGFSIGIIDCVVPQSVLDDVKEGIDQLKISVDREIANAQAGKLEPNPGMTFMQTFETNVNNMLNKILGSSSDKVMSKIRKDNSLMEMLSAGSKGANTNIGQIIALVGQQNMEGKRVRFGFKGRTLPHYLKGEYGLVPRGFCEHPYLLGLTPQEFIFHAMAGRTGIIDTACKTSDTGYIQRRLCKSMESHHVAYDGTVRNSLNEVIQFIYGGDGLDATGLETQRIRLATLGDSAFKDAYELDYTDSTFGQDALDPNALEDFQRSPDRDEKLSKELKRLRKFRDILQTEIFPTGENTVVLPVNIERIITTSQREYDINIHSSKSDLNPIDVIDRVHDLAKSLIIVKGNDAISRTAQKNATLLLRMMLYSNLSAKQVIFKHRLNEKAFKYIIGAVKDIFYRTIVAPGEMVGTLAGQSIGEPSTQMTLNTFHFAGISAHDVTLGVPRLNELMNLAKSIRTPSVTVKFDREIDQNEEEAQRVRAEIESAIFKKFVQKSEIYFDPDPRDTTVPEDADWLPTYIETMNMETNGLAPWVLRFVLDPQSLKQNEIEVSHIADVIRREYNGFTVAYYDNDVDVKILRIQARTNSDGSKFDDKIATEEFLRETEQELYSTLILKGIRGITRVRRADEREKSLKENHEWETRKVFVLYTEGTALRQILAVDHVDQQRTFTNDIHQTNEVLGIEAARNALTYEMMLIMDGASASLNRRHLDMLADTMCHYGVPYPASRHGINKTPYGVLMRASYEKTNDIFFDAAAFAETDKMEDISSSVIAGKPSRAGTGIVDVLINESLLPNIPSASADDQPLIGPATPFATLSPVARYDEGAFSQNSQIVTSPFADPTSQLDSQSVSSPFSPNYNDAMSPVSPLGGYGAVSPMISGGGEAMSPMISSYGEAMSPLAPRPSFVTTNLSPNISKSSYNQGNQNFMQHAYSPLSNASPVLNASPASPVMSALSPAIGNYSPASPLVQADPGYSPGGYGSSTRYNPLSPGFLKPSDQGISGYSPSNSPASPLYEPAKKDKK